MKGKTPKLVRCRKCDRQFFSAKRKSLEGTIHNLNVMFYKLTKTEQRSIYGSVPFSMDEFLKCDKCGNSYDNFSPVRKEPKAHRNDVGFILDANE